MSKHAPPADLSLTECALASGLSPLTVRNKIQAGALAAFRVGTCLRVEPRELARFMEARRVPVVPTQGAA